MNHQLTFYNIDSICLLLFIAILDEVQALVTVLSNRIHLVKLVLFSFLWDVQPLDMTMFSVQAKHSQRINDSVSLQATETKGLCLPSLPEDKMGTG